MWLSAAGPGGVARRGAGRSAGAGGVSELEV